MTPYKHQIDIAEEALVVLRMHYIVYLAMEERTGKTLTAILTCENSKAKNILVLTKEKAVDGWVDTLLSFRHSKTYKVTNYHQACNIKGDFDIIVLDEAHSYLSAYPKTGKIWKDVKLLTNKKPIIYLSATPSAQGYQLLFNQFKLSSWTPWKHRTFYDWFREYGISNMVRTPYGLQETYSKCKADTFDSVKHLFLQYTRADLNFEYEPEDVLHYIELSDNTKKIYNASVKNEMLEVGSIKIPLDTPMKLRTSLHMLEGGVAKHTDTYLYLDNDEKIKYILDTFGDTEDLVIMYNYIAEGTKLNVFFKKAKILQGTSHAEGVDLSMHKHLVIYSTDFSTARHSQRRARQANKSRKEEIKVHFLLVKDAISEQVYNTIHKNKTNFVDAYFERKTL